jgi:hypothetical protein
MRSEQGLYKKDTIRVDSQIGVSEDSQSRQTVKYGHESRGTRNQESLCWPASSNLLVSQSVSQSEAGGRRPRLESWATTSEDTADWEEAV